MSDDDSRRRTRRVRGDDATRLRDEGICRRIAQAREDAGLTQKQMAAVLDVGQRAYQNFESDRVPWDLLLEVSKTTGVPVEWLLRGEEAILTPDRRALREELTRFVADPLAERLRRLESQVAELQGK